MWKGLERIHLMVFSGAAAGEWQSGLRSTQQFGPSSSEDQTGAVSAVAAVAAAASSSRYIFFIITNTHFIVLTLYL
jgi:hypothetical protein